MRRRSFLLGSAATIAGAAVAKALPAGAIEFPPAPETWGEVTGAATDFGAIPPGLLRAWSASLWDAACERSFLMSFVEGADGSVSVYQREPCPFVPFQPALAPPAQPG